jgi:hypothetical protein
MSRESPPSRFRTAFDAVLREYEGITNITLAAHPIAEKLKNCHSVESFILLIQDLAQEFGDFPGTDRIMKSLNNSVSLLSMLAAIPVLGNTIGIVCQLARLSWVCSASDTYYTAIPAYNSNTNWHRHPTYRMYPFIVVLMCVSFLHPSASGDKGSEDRLQTAS